MQKSEPWMISIEQTFHDRVERYWCQNTMCWFLYEEDGRLPGTGYRQQRKLRTEEVRYLREGMDEKPHARNGKEPQFSTFYDPCTVHLGSSFNILEK